MNPLIFLDILNILKIYSLGTSLSLSHISFCAIFALLKILCGPDNSGKNSNKINLLVVYSVSVAASTNVKMLTKPGNLNFKGSFSCNSSVANKDIDLIFFCLKDIDL